MYRLGTTSFVIPATHVENLGYIAKNYPMICDVELLVFESDEISPLPTTDEVREMQELALKNDLSFTIHLPVDIDLATTEEAIRTKSVDKLKRVYERMQVLNPLAWNLHPTQGERDLLFKSLSSLIEVFPKETLTLENTHFPYQDYLPLAKDLGLSLCLDVGHLLLEGQTIDELFPLARVMHLHAVDGKKDHRDLSYFEPEALKRIMKNFKGEVLTIEVFGEEKFKKSLQTLKELS